MAQKGGSSDVLCKAVHHSETQGAMGDEIAHYIMIYHDIMIDHP